MVSSLGGIFQDSNSGNCMEPARCLKNISHMTALCTVRLSEQARLPELLRGSRQVKKLACSLGSETPSSEAGFTGCALLAGCPTSRCELQFRVEEELQEGFLGNGAGLSSPLRAGELSFSPILFNLLSPAFLQNAPTGLRGFLFSLRQTLLKLFHVAFPSAIAC